MTGMLLASAVSEVVAVEDEAAEAECGGGVLAEDFKARFRAKAVQLTILALEEVLKRLLGKLQAEYPFPATRLLASLLWMFVNWKCTFIAFLNTM
jgi:hypothetical protein